MGKAIDININEEYVIAKQLIFYDQSCNINKFKMLKDKKEHYFREHPSLLQNKVLKNFLEDEYNLCVFVLALFGEKEVNNLLNEQFKKFYVQYRFISYISKLLYFEAINFDKKVNRQMIKEPTILDMPFEENGNIKLSDAILKEEKELEYQTHTLEELIVDEKVFKEYKKLTKKQQLILYHSYYALLKDREIAEKLNITQQAVSKNRRKALSALRKSFRGEEHE